MTGFMSPKDEGSGRICRVVYLHFAEHNHAGNTEINKKWERAVEYQVL